MDNNAYKALRQASERRYQANRVSFWLNGKPLTAEIPPAQTTLEFLQQTQQLWGTKCSCNEGDCGACTVVVARFEAGGTVYEAVNSCLYTAAKLQGKHLITIEALGTPEHLHPIQQAMLDFHSTQCGYCSPGFVMSLFALLAMEEHPSKATLLSALEGNLCRCTGYNSILQAARFLAENYSPGVIVPQWCRDVEAQLAQAPKPPDSVVKSGMPLRHCQRYHRPQSIGELTALLQNESDCALINGGTDIMVQMNVQRRQFPVLIDLGGIADLDGITISEAGLGIGANVTYTGLLNSEAVRVNFPCLVTLVQQIASQQIRNFATLAGNIANASPIGDTLPLLLVLDAGLRLVSASGEREIPLREFYLEYRKTALRQGEFIREILIPFPAPDAFIQAQKSAKRKAVDISSVVSAVRIEVRDGHVSLAELALGGVAPVPALSRKFHNALASMELQGLHAPEIADFVAAEFKPISDVRGSANYRAQLIRNHVLKHLADFLEGRRA